MVNPKKKDLFVGYETGTNGKAVVDALMSTGLYEKDITNEETLKIITKKPRIFVYENPTQSDWTNGIVWMYKRLWVFENKDVDNWFYQHSEFHSSSNDLINNPKSIEV